jgi:hypothetical protein
MKKTRNLKTLITTTMLALTLNSAINSTAHANDSEIFASFGLGELMYTHSPVVGSLKDSRDHDSLCAIVLKADNTVLAGMFLKDNSANITISRTVFQVSMFNFGYSSFFDNNLYYKVAGNIALLGQLDVQTRNSRNTGIINLYNLTVGMGYNTNFYYSPEFSISAYSSEELYQNQGTRYGMGFSISPLSFKFPVTENISVLLDAFKININQELNPQINSQIGAFNTILNTDIKMYNASLGISYKL